MIKSLKGRAAGASQGSAGRAAFGALLLLAIVLLPNDSARLREPVMPALPLEWLVLVGLLLLVPSALAGALRVLVLLLAAALLFLKLADIGTIAAFSRPFNPVLDLHLLNSGWHLLSGTVGPARAVGAVLAVLAAFAVILFLLTYGLKGLTRWRPPAARRLGVAGLAAGVLGSLFALGGPTLPGLSLDASRLAADRARLLTASIRDLARFETELAGDPAADFAPERLLADLAGKDVLVLFVESYGRSAVEGERYAADVNRRLSAIDESLETAGFSARSGWLTAPTVGGQSWLSHATLLSGLWIDSQQRYDRLVTSRRASLNSLFARAGWRTVAAMPAITMDWPEARWYGYDALYPASRLGYRGEPFNWVTMPDQYTLAALHRLELGRSDRPPVMAEVALISSHAPWTPIPPLLAWDAVGDGTVFNESARSGDPPDVVWRDPERVRDQYALSIDYALETIGSFVETFGGDDLVLLVLGDHQPAPLVTGPDASRDVPVHLIAADPAVLNAAAAWNWTAGMRPAAAAPVWRMDELRLRFLQAFSGAASG